jgi:hypothetical protein
MKNMNYAAIIGIIIVVAVIGVTSYLGVSQLQTMRIDDGTEITKNITVQTKEVVNRQYLITDTDNIKYITSEKVHMQMMKGRNFTVSVSTINNGTGYWITTSTDIKPIKGGK